jgi:hypothetical protein
MSAEAENDWIDSPQPSLRRSSEQPISSEHRGWRRRFVRQPEHRAEKLARRLHVASEALLFHLFSYLSKLPDDMENQESTMQPSSCGITLPACAVGWLASQFFGENASHNDGDVNESLDMSVLSTSVRDRLSLLKFLLPRLTHLRISAEKWPTTFSEKDREKIHNFSYYDDLVHRPCIDLRLFPNCKVLLLDQVAPEWIQNLSTLKGTLQVLRMERGCIFDLPSLFEIERHALLTDSSDPLAEHPEPLPHEAVYYSSLTHLKLSDCSLGESAGLCGTENKCPPLSRMMHLQYLCLSHNTLSSERTILAGLVNKPFLSKLDLSFNSLRSLKHAHMRLGNIQSLNLAHNQISCSRGIDRIYSLESLFLEHNRIEDLAQISGLSRLPVLMTLRLEGNPIALKRKKGFRVAVLNGFREQRLSGLPAYATFRQLQNVLPILDGKIATIDEMRAIRDRTFVRLESIVFTNADDNWIQVDNEDTVAISECEHPTPFPQNTPLGLRILLKRRKRQRLALIDAPLQLVPKHHILLASKTVDEGFQPDVTFTLDDVLQSLALNIKEKSDRNMSLSGECICTESNDEKSKITFLNEEKSLYELYEDSLIKAKASGALLVRFEDVQSNEKDLALLVEDDQFQSAAALPKMSPQSVAVLPKMSTSAECSSIEERERCMRAKSEDKIGRTTSAPHRAADTKKERLNSIAAALAKRSTATNLEPEQRAPGKADVTDARLNDSMHDINQVTAKAMPTINATVDSWEGSKQDTQVSVAADAATITRISDNNTSIGPLDALIPGHGRTSKLKKGMQNSSQADDSQGKTLELATISVIKNGQEDDQELKSSGALTGTTIDTNAESRSETIEDNNKQGEPVQMREVDSDNEGSFARESSKERSDSPSSQPTESPFQISFRPVASTSCGSMWQDDCVSDPSSRLSPNVSTCSSQRNTFQRAEEMSSYERPYEYRDFPVRENLDAYFKVFVFNMLEPSHDPLLFEGERNLQEDWISVLEQYPKIQMWLVDLRMREGLKERARLTDRTIPTESFRRVWFDKVVACGEPALRRLTPNRGARYGFHGELLWSAASTSSLKPETVAECREVIFCLSDASLYVILDYDAVTEKAKEKKRKFPLPIPREATFKDSKWPHALAHHPLNTLKSVTIGFGFQRLTLRFANSTFPCPDDFTYVLLACNKHETVRLLKDIQKLTDDARSLSVATTLSDPIVIDNDDRHFLDALGVAVAPEVIGAVLHYQILQQRWRSGDRGSVRRVCIVTDLKIFLLDEDYVGDGSETIEAGSRTLGETTYRLVDSADLSQINEVVAADFDPNTITISIHPLSRLQRIHNWRLVCRDRYGAEKLVEDLRKAWDEVCGLGGMR